MIPGLGRVAFRTTIQYSHSGRVAHALFVELHESGNAQIMYSKVLFSLLFVSQTRVLLHPSSKY